MNVGDTVTAANYIMDFTSVPLTLGKEYEVAEVVSAPDSGGMELIVIKETDNGRQGMFARARFRKVR